MADKLPELLNSIQQHHLREPGVEQQLAFVLEKFGLIDYERGMGVPQAPPEPVAAPAAESPVLWTPDQAPEPAAETEEPSKLWLPDS